MNAVEINSTFYRLPEKKTLERWAESTPDDFRFAVKLSRSITHERKLKSAAAELKKFFAAVKPLGKKMGPVLVQLPPSLKFAAKGATEFFERLRAVYSGPVVCEPRNANWFELIADVLMRDFKVSRVAADPAVTAAAAKPGGWAKTVYFRLHGSPRKYYSSYSEEYLQALAKQMRQLQKTAAVWCVFDNTASGAACQNALRLRELTGS